MNVPPMRRRPDDGLIDMWQYWTDQPPSEEVVECQRDGDDEPFWLRPDLVDPAYNICGVKWRPLGSTDLVRASRIFELQLYLRPVE